MKGRLSAIWRTKTKLQKTEDGATKDVCSCCGASINRPRNTAGEIAVTIISTVMLLTIAIPAAWAMERWMEQESHQVFDHMMIWREPIENWDQ